MWSVYTMLLPHSLFFLEHDIHMTGSSHANNTTPYMIEAITKTNSNKALKSKKKIK